MPLADWDRTAFYGPSRFTSDPARDEYRCPGDQLLRRAAVKYGEEVIVYQADSAVCNACPFKAACTESKTGRRIQRSFHAAYLDKVRDYHQTAAYERAMRKRQVCPRMKRQVGGRRSSRVGAT